MSISRLTQVISFTAAGAGTTYTTPFSVDSDAGRVAIQAKRLTGSGTLALTLQGGWASSVVGTATDWVDLDFTCAAISTAQLTELKTTGGANQMLLTYSTYRIKVVTATAAATGEFRVLTCP